MTFEFLHPASREFEEALDWYAERSARAAEGFRATVRDAIHRAMENPTSAGFLVGKRSRKILLDPYRYGLIYFVHGEYLYIVAIVPNRKPPRYWTRRIKNA
jgi:plasmid stabilization system protein ParE